MRNIPQSVAASAALGPTGASDPLTTPIQQNTLLGRFGTTPIGFLQSSSSTTQGATGGTWSDGHAGHGNGGEHLGQLLAVGQLTADLTTIDGVLRASHDGKDTLYSLGSHTPHVTGVGAAFGSLDDHKKPDLNHLKHDEHDT